MKISIKGAVGILVCLVSLTIASCNGKNDIEPKTDITASTAKVASQQDSIPVIDTADYEKRMVYLSNGDTTGHWPIKPTIHPLPGAILPYHRIVAYYGNLYSKRMGVLGQFPKKEMLGKLKVEIAKWERADSTLPVMPALHYVAVTAQSKGGKNRMRMPFRQIDTIVKWTNEIEGIAFLDIQVGWSTLEEEVPELEKYLKMPNVHLGVDPEFSMKDGAVPGKKIGTFNADDINYTINYLTDLVKKHNLPPKILVVHRFTQGMVRNATDIKPTPQVQVVMDMDGWGDKILKRSTWLRYIKKEPVQFTGFKLFYKNDTRKDPDGMYTPDEVANFIPRPIYIQYQ